MIAGCGVKPGDFLFGGMGLSDDIAIEDGAAGLSVRVSMLWPPGMYSEISRSCCFERCRAKVLPVMLHS